MEIIGGVPLGSIPNTEKQKYRNKNPKTSKTKSPLVKVC